MKKISILLFVFALSIVNLNAQSEDYNLTLSANAGYSLSASLVKAAFDASSVLGSVDSRGMPVAAQFTADYALRHNFSLGLALSYQTFSADFKDYSYYDENMDFQTDAFTTRFTHLNIAIRPLFHYANSGNLDLYSGLRLGYSNVGFSSDSRDRNYDVSVDFGGFALQVVLIGGRAYITENLGVGAELALGFPHTVSFGLSYRM